MAWRTHDLGRLFVQPIAPMRRGSPLVHTATTWEVDPPYRRARSTILRFWPFKRGVGIGWWFDTEFVSREDVEADMDMVPSRHDIRYANRTMSLEYPYMPRDGAVRLKIRQFVLDHIDETDEEFEVSVMTQLPT